LPCIYLPTLNTPFDFIDDGNLVYPAPPLSTLDRVHLGWQKVVANYEHLGPFRPTLWLHWEVQAELLQANPLHWRLLRLIWTGFAAGMFLWLLRELRIHPIAALVASAIAMWNPYRNEIWTSLTLAEGVAMPYALLSLVCAIRAARSSRAWIWDLVGAGCVLMALGCKNTFSALVPAQIFLRVVSGNPDWRLAWRQQRWRALLLSLTLFMPVIHFVYFKLNWHPGQYRLGSPTFGNLARYLAALQGAVSLDFLGVGLVLGVIAAIIAWRNRTNANSSETSETSFWREYRSALIAGAVLLAGGVALYLPLGAISGRYTMPAVWGLDIAIAVLLTAVWGFAAWRWKRVCFIACAVGLVAAAVANIGKQEKFAARAELLHQALAWIEKEALAGTRIAWVGESNLGGQLRSQGGLNIEEGIHFGWHLHARGRNDVRVGLVDANGQPQARCELAPLAEPPTIIVAADSSLPKLARNHGQNWQSKEIIVRYWWGRRQFQCYLWTDADVLAKDVGTDSQVVVSKQHR